jgi:hypothetical protein
VADFIGWCSVSRPSRPDLGQTSSLFNSILHSVLGMAITLLRMENGYFVVLT